MRIQVLFEETSVLVPCGDGKLTVKELVDKAIVRFKKVLNKPDDEVIEVHRVRLADSGSFVALDDEVADVLEDKEVVELEFSFNTPYGRNGDDDDLPADADTMTTLSAYSTDNLDSAHPVPRSYSNDLHDPMISGLEPYGSAELGMPSGDHHTPSLEHLSDVDPASTPTSLHIRESPRGTNNSQDIENIMNGGGGGGGVWHSQNSGSQSLDPSSPNLGGRKAEWRTSADTGYATSKSQESYSQSQPKSQEATYHSHHTPPSGSDVGALGFGTSDHAPGAGGGSDGDGRHGEGMRDFPHPHQRSSSLRGSNRMDFGSGSGGGVGPKGIHGNENHQTSSNNSTPSHSKPYLGQRSKDDFSKSFRDPLQPIPQDDPMRFGVGRRQTPPGGSGDSFSPNQSHLSSSHGSSGGPTDYPPMGGRGYDGYPGYGGYGGYPMPPNDKQRYFDHFKRRYGGGPGEFHPQAGGPPYGNMPGPGGRHMVGPYGGRPPGGYPDFYDPRSGAGGRFARPHDPHYPPRLAHAMSHERMDGATPSSYTGRGGRLGGVDEEFPIDMYLSQPTTGYFNLESPGGYGMPPVMGPMYDPRLNMGGPSSGSLSQPGFMMSHRPGGMLPDMDARLGGGPHPLHFAGSMGGLAGDNKGSQGRASSVKSVESLDRGHRSLSVEDDFVLDPEDEEDRPKERNPFQRDLRKSTYGDSSVYSQWMQRIYDYDIQEDKDDSCVPQFDGETGSGHMPAVEGVESLCEREGQEEESGEEDEEYGNIHIVELPKCGEQLGLQLTHYTSPEGLDVGVYIAAMDPEGFAAKSGKLQVQDRILACNGTDFTKNMTNQHVEEIFTAMLKEPLLRMAISRGGFRGSLQAKGSGIKLPAVAGGVAGGDKEGGSGVSMSADGSGVSITVGGNDEERGVAVGAGEDATPSGARPTIKIVAPPAAPSQAASLARTNTRQIGARHSITIQRGSKGFGFGLTSRDVRTDDQNQMVYVKSIHHGGPAYQDGRLRIGDRILEVNGEDVAGMSRPEVVQLLRASLDSVSLVISRQGVDEEEQQELEEPQSAGPDPTPPPLTVSKTVLNLEIPLHNSGPAGLGVTVYTKATGSKGGGEMGVYIKSIVPGGAAAMDGRLCKNDQVLSVNQQNLLGHSNQEAMDILRQAMAGHNTVQLVVARRTAPSSPSMAALGEEPEEEEKETGDHSTEATHNEVGIDVPIDAPPTSSTPFSHSHSHPATSGMLASGSGHNLHRGASVGANPLQGSGSAHNLQGSTHPSAASLKSLSAQTSIGEVEPSRGSMRGRAATFSTSSPSRSRQGSSGGDPTSPLTKTISLPRSQDLMGSGEFYDRLEPLPTTSSSPSTSVPAGGVAYATAPPTVFSHFASLYDEAAVGVAYPPLSDRHTSSHPHNTSSLDRRDISSLDQRGVTRQTSHPVATRSHPPHMSRDMGASPRMARMPPRDIGASPRMSRDITMATRPHPLSPSDIDYQLYSPTGTGSSSSRDNSIPRHYYQNHQRNSSYDSRNSSHFSDSSTVMSHGHAMAEPPIRGSGRKDRNRPERGSGRSHISQMPGLVSDSPELMMNGFATVPRTSSTSAQHNGPEEPGGGATGMTPSSSMGAASLENLRLSDSECNAAFRRDNPGRISITKKTKKNPREDLAHLRFDNSTPLVEGEKALVRAGSDSFLNQHNSSPQHNFMESMEIGPSLGMVKSSSLESLHNVMHHHIKRDVVDDGSFKRAVDHSYEAGEERGGAEQAQRGVDVGFGLENGSSMPAMISFTKSPHAAKTKKKGFFKNVFKKRKNTKKEKPSPESARKQRGLSMEISPDSLTAEERDKLMRHYTLQLRPQAQTAGGGGSHSFSGPSSHSSHSGASIGANVEGLLPPGVFPGTGIHGNRHSMSALDDYDSPDSPDELLLASMAKV